MGKRPRRKLKDDVEKRRVARRNLRTIKRAIEELEDNLELLDSMSWLGPARIIIDSGTRIQWAAIGYTNTTEKKMKANSDQSGHVSSKKDENRT